MSMSAKDIEQAARDLPLDARRKLVAALVWSLPRTEVTELHERLAQMMQKDIIGCLPVELGVRILALLDADELLNCRGVNRTWARLCDDQLIWRELCRTHVPPIEPSPTSWNDVNLHRERLHAAQRILSPPPDESFEYPDEELSMLTQRMRDSQFMQSSSSASASMSTSPSPAPLAPLTSPATPSPRHVGARRMVWERSHGGLPTYQRAAGMSRISSELASPVATPQGLSAPSALDPPVLSHLQLPTAMPKVNYKHLFLVRRILSRRMTDCRPADLESNASGRRTSPTWNPRVTILKPQTSPDNGGLPGHPESIYSLQLFRRPMRITMSLSDEEDVIEPRFAPEHSRSRSRVWPTSDVFGTPVSASWPGLSRMPRAPQHTTVVHSRDWLLSGSRDCTLRLWQIGCAAPRVVKVFAGGHQGSILSHFVTEIPIDDETPDSPPPRKKSAKSPMRTPGTPSRAGPNTRLVAVSGGSDGRICLWDIEHGDGTPTKSVKAHTDSVLFVRGDTERIVSCSKDRTIRLFDIRTLEQLLIIHADADGHRGAINAVALTKDFIISASGDKSIKVWDINTGRVLASIDAHMKGISSLTFEPFASPLAGWEPDVPESVLLGTIVTGSSDASIKTFHIVQLPPWAKRHIDEALTFRDMLHLDTFDLCEDESVRRIVIQRGVEYRAMCSCVLSNVQNVTECRRCFNRGHKDLVRSLHLSDHVTLSASYDSTIKMWDRQSGRLIFDFEGCHTGRVFAITRDHTRVVSSGIDAHIAIIDFSEGLDTAFV